MALDINQSQKSVKKICAQAHKMPGNSYLPGITWNSYNTNKLNQGEYIYGGFYFPVDSYVWSTGCEFTAGVAMKNIESDYENANGVLYYGIQFLSNRDLLYNTSKGRTPYLPGSKEGVSSTGAAMQWDAFASPSSGIPISPINTGVQLPTHGIGWLNKSARLQLAFGSMSTGQPSKKVNVNFTKKVRTRGSKRKKSRGFDVSAGTKIVYWMYNKSGEGDSESEVICDISMVPRLEFVPKQDITQNFNYEDQAKERWGENTTRIARTEDGDGIGAFWLPIRVSTYKEEF